MKKLLVILTIHFIVMVLVYLSFSFILLEFNPINWSKDSRVSLIFIYFFSIGISIPVSLLIIDELKD